MKLLESISFLALASASTVIAGSPLSNIYHTSSPFGIVSDSSHRRASKATVSEKPLKFHYEHEEQAIEMAGILNSATARNIIRGSLLRIASDITGGTPLESIKTRVTVSKDNMFEAYNHITSVGGIGNLWSGTPSRTVEGALLGAAFMVGSVPVKNQVLALTGSPVAGSLAGGIVGGLAQAIVMTPAGMIFTSLNVNKGKPGYENDNALIVTKRIVKEKGIGGMFIGGKPMALRQASNWASRSAFTEIARSTLGMSKYGLLGEIGSGVIGGLGSCWNTPIETCRVFIQKDVSEGKTPKTFMGYVQSISEEDGVPGLFRGVTPRGIQAIWQTVFMVVVPNVLGV